MEKWGNEICGRGKTGETLTKSTQIPFRSPRNPHGGPRRELGTPAVGGEYLTASATESPKLRLLITII